MQHQLLEHAGLSQPQVKLPNPEGTKAAVSPWVPGIENVKATRPARESIGAPEGSEASAQ